MKNTSFIIILLMICGLFGFSQDVYLTTNSKPIDPDRYGEIKGSPYFFRDWVIGNVVSNEGEVTEGVQLNLNGYSESFEIKKGETYTDIDNQYYLRIEVYADKNPKEFKGIEEEKIVFQRGMHARFKSRMPHLIYSGKHVSLLDDFDIVLDEKEVQNVGKKVEFKRFQKRHTYYLLRDGELKLIKLQRKKFIAALGHKAELEKFMKSNKTDFRSNSDIAKLLAYYEEIM